MATKYWLANTPTAWDTGAAWTGGAKPGGSDDAVFRADNVGNVLAPAGAETVGNVYVTEGYSGQMGTSGGKLTVSATKLSYKGVGPEAWFVGSYDDALIDHPRYDANAFNLEATFASNERCKVLSGRVNLSGTYITLIIARGREGRDPEVVGNAGVSIDRLHMEAGVVTINAGAIVSDYCQLGGLVDLIDATDEPGRIVMGGGTLRVSGSTDRTWERCYILRGNFDCSQLRGLLTLNSFVVVGRAGVVNFDNGRTCVGNAGTWVDVIPGGVFRQYGSGLTVQLL